MVTEFITLNLLVPNVTDKNILETVGNALWIILEEHKTLGLELTEFSVQEHAKLNMGDCAAELCNGTDEDFDNIFYGADSVLTRVLASNWSNIENFAQQLNGIYDVMVFTYDNLIRLCVSEKSYPCSRTF